MTQETRRRKWRWLRHTAWVLGIKLLLITAGLIIFFGSGAGNPFLKRALIRKLNAATGGSAEVQSLSIEWLALRGTLKGVVVHGKEPQGTEPLFSAEEIDAGLRIDSFWGRKVSLNNLKIAKPHIHIRSEKNGATNIPTPPGPKQNSTTPVSKTLFDLKVKQVQLLDGWVLYNDVRTPFAVEGSGLRLAVNAGGSAEKPIYLGTMDWKEVQVAAKRFVPVPVNLSMKFSITPDGFELEQAQIGAGRSRIDLQGRLTNYSDPNAAFKYRVWLEIGDFRKTFRSPLTPTGKVDVRGEGTLSSGVALGSGSFVGTEINLSYTGFQDSGVGARGSYKFDKNGIQIPDFVASAFGGTVSGPVTMKFPGLEFVAKTHIQDIRMARVLPALERASFPVNELHWDSVITADTVETWSGTFAHFEISGTMDLNAPGEIASQHVPVIGGASFNYRYDSQTLALDTAQFDTPTSRIHAGGSLGKRSSGLDIQFETSALEDYEDFIDAIRGPNPEGSRPALSGSAKWDGKLSGPLGGPTLAGHARGEKIAYGDLHLDSLEADMTYSPSELSISQGRAKLGAMQADVEGSMDLDEWIFRPENEWTADVNFETVPLESFQEFVKDRYPVGGTLTGQFHGHGTRANPSVNGLFDLAEGDAYGVSFNRLRGQLNVTPEEVHISNAELRVFAPGKEKAGAGIVTGSAGYRFADGNISVDLVGAGLPLENFEKLQSPRMPVGGQMTFHMKATGPAKTPQGEGSIRIVDLRIGQEIIGSFDGTLSSDGHEAKVELSSAMTDGSVSGGYTIGLTPPYPVHGKANIRNINLDPFLVTYLHLKHFSGHGGAEGEIGLEGNLSQPSAIVMDAKFSRLSFNYSNVQLENAGPVHFRASVEELNIDPVAFEGKDTNFKLEGSARFTGRRTLALKLNGALDLRLISGFVPNLDARGPAQVNASFEGTLDRPKITGRVHIENASARVADFPTGLSAIKGDLVFDATRLSFDNVTAEAGGGTLTLTGSVNYADSPIHYDITARTDRTRIRYPEGMSWQVAGNLRLSGTPDAGLLSGRVTIDRVNLSGGLEAAGALIASHENGGTTSTFLQNLQFDIEALSTPDARMEWPNAELEADANLRVRGTWEHPILLGHIHVLSGDLYFHGNRYRVARGDLNFARPLNIDPDINIEATTTIQQYEITLNFSGPASKLNLSYRSDPPLPGNDIVTLLTLGQTSSEAELRAGGTGSAQSPGSGASALLSEAISSQLGGRLERLFGITKLRVDPGLAGVGSTGSEQSAAARVTVEQQVTRNLTITYVSNVSSTQQQVIQVEYNVNRNVSIVALRDQNGTFGIDVKIKKRFP
ncbi:MAG: translocation/assembly module TamB domain-containing protein [Acidobacteria bacterium]|nr:translocation/assembly module TamB domain-containing protein [Acidobacteriota bacterium]MBS1864462.1 translocation/assembly module TamB domain-containing protein [Acidobacteriota bacterium]